MSALGLYIHWPYCTAICPYCDFNVYRARGAAAEPLIRAIESDLAAHAARFGARVAQSVFFGGGTPSLLRGDEIARILDAASRAFTLAADCEITLEANPENASFFAEQAAAGVNRFSVGVQALDDGALKALGRKHDAKTALRAIDAAAATHQRVSADLIYAREGQSDAAWREELTRALALPVEHLSLYELTIEPGTAFARRAERGQLTPPDDETAARLYETTQELCEAAGFQGYEISNYARAPDAQARHNLIYWRSDDWIGVGPGAHGRITHDGVRTATESQLRPADYIDAVRENGVGWIRDVQLTDEQTADEMILMGLRTVEGLNIDEVAERRKRPINRDALDWLRGAGLIVVDGARVRLAPAGRLLANKISAELAI